jgi:preprotein translocase subunit SecG
MFQFLLIIQTLVAASLVTVILMQRSEGGGLGVGGSSSGFMTARGAADFLTRATGILGALFVLLSIVLAAIAGATRDLDAVDTSLVNQVAPIAPATPGAQPGQPVQQAPAAPTQNQDAPAVPLAQ